MRPKLSRTTNECVMKGIAVESPVKQRGSAWAFCQVLVRAELFTFARTMFHGKLIGLGAGDVQFERRYGALQRFQLIGRSVCNV